MQHLYNLMEKVIFFRAENVVLLWLTSHQQCHWAWGNSGISIFIHKVQYTLDKRMCMQLHYKTNCTASIFLMLFLHKLVY